MEGRKEKISEAKLDEQEIFAITGPVHLTSLHWGIPDHKASVASSLVQGVYTLETDRQQRRTGHKALAPPWWEFFHFECIQILIDQVDFSIFGAVFEYKHYNPNNHRRDPNMKPQENVPPKYVIAFRGTLILSETRKQDFYMNMHLVLNGLAKRSRYQVALQAVQGILSRAINPASVWLAGHSLGAAIALQAGRYMTKLGFHIESYLFNPPFPSIPIEQLKDPNLKSKIRYASSFVTAGLSFAIRGRHNSKQQHDPFPMLRSWIPNLFVNPMDPICCEYIGYFEHRQKMEERGAGGIEKIATKNSIMGLLLGALGRDSEALHLIPSALLTKNLIPMAQDYKQAHCIHQWWQPQLHWHSRLYQLA